MALSTLPERVLRAQFDHTPFAQIIHDEDGRIIAANNAAYRLFGYSADELRAMTLLDLIHTEDRQNADIIHAELHNGDQPYVDVEKRVQCKDGTALDCQTTLYTLRDDDGAHYTVAVFQEVSARKRRDELLQIAAHDLKNPLTNIASAASMLGEMVGKEEEARQLLRLIQTSLNHAFDLIRNVSNLSRVGQGVPLERQTVALNDFLQETLEAFRVTAESKAIRLHFVPLKVDQTLMIDPVLMRQAVNNLLSNALKYTPDGGEVTLGALLTADEVIIEVADNGLGIPNAELPKVFERFYRVPSSAHLAVDGTGLGLSILKAIVEQHEGRVWVESELDKGSAFYIALPLDDE